MLFHPIIYYLLSLALLFLRISSRITSLVIRDDLPYLTEATHNSADHDDAPTIYEKSGGIEWTRAGLCAEMAGQILAATETTSSALTFIFYEIVYIKSSINEIVI
ncbi:hypothetical protein CROQUDRAFT_99203 [Cronartium quercuum f. sp. fusiforme G11]|uniref:Uncharacterized protein n=1 Tax=Cronartium quercuum f. sp. fusiforme G11 TaxID=708437 RepID=A0A9P6N763_9BASI|nr:hypothetical protein CROQUDRAFT_99203 [Cronartium quercuum f. sp. fusiforme G11]